MDPDRLVQERMEFIAFHQHLQIGFYFAFALFEVYLPLVDLVDQSRQMHFGGSYIQIQVLSSSRSFYLFLRLYYFFLFLFFCLERSSGGNYSSMFTWVLLNYTPITILKFLKSGSSLCCSLVNRFRNNRRIPHFTGY